MIQTPDGLRYFGKFRAKVVDNKDPKSGLRIRCEMPAFGEGAQTPWAIQNPKLLTESVPEIGETVFIEFEQGDPNFPLYSGDFPTLPDISQEMKDAYKSDPDDIHLYSLERDYNENKTYRSPDGVKTEDVNGNIIETSPDGINFNEGTKGVARLDDTVISDNVTDSAFFTWLTGFVGIINNWVVAPTDGGGALQIAMKAYILASPIPSKLDGKINSSSDSVKAGD